VKIQIGIVHVARIGWMDNQGQRNIDDQRDSADTDCDDQSENLQCGSSIVGCMNVRFTEIEANQTITCNNDSETTQIEDNQQGQIDPIEECLDAKWHTERISMEIVDIDQWQ
jgi:hypothetical protein